MHQCLRSPTTGHERGGGGWLPAIFSPLTLASILAGNENEPTCFRLGNGTTSFRSGPGQWVRVRDLTRYLHRYLYISRGIYISLGVFIYPAVFINPQRYLYIPRGISKSPAVFINPSRYL